MCVRGFGLVAVVVYGILEDPSRDCNNVMQ